ncbi:unnamed protein product [Ilex paraguariensis]|uniref:DUF3741 domain-containing protein n=1 Tax=Ilex paraguariensis TaxID=185542 RepID=A0ABC8RRY7_9AQUA
MDRARHRKSKIPSEGYSQIQKPRTAPKLASDSNICSGDTTEEDVVMFELAQSSSRRVTGTPMKKLLAEEMFKETEARRRSPSVIARLMGLDGLPSLQPVHRQQKRLSDSYQQRTASIGIPRNAQFCDSRSNSKSSMEQQEFKDVYEDLEASHIANRRYSSKWNVDSKFTKPEVAFMQKKFVDEKLQHSKGYFDTLHMLDSRKDLMLKSYQQPDYLFVKHLRDLKSDQPSSLGGKIAILKPSNAAKYEGSAKGWKSERETSCKHDIKTHRRRADGLLLHPYNSNGARNSLKSSKGLLEGKDDKGVLSTRIVVLKPNLGNANIGVKSVFSPDFPHAYQSDSRKHIELSSVGIGKAGSWKNKELSNDVGFSRPQSGEARQIAKEVTRQMRESLFSGQINFSYSGSESEVITLNSRNSTNWNHQIKHSSFGSTESSVSREAKKRLSESWKLTHRHPDLGVVGRGSTLGEMLAIPDKKPRPENVDAVMVLDGVCDVFGSSNGASGCDSHLVISSRDGWKDGCIRNSSRSRSRPLLSFDSGSHRIVAQREAFVEERYLMPKEAMGRSRSKAVKGSLGQKENVLSKSSRSSRKKSHSSRNSYTDCTDPLPEVHFSQVHEEINFNRRTLSEQQPMVSQTHDNNDTCASYVVDAVADEERESVTIPSKSSDEFLPDSSASSLGSGNSTARDAENQDLQV